MVSTENLHIKDLNIFILLSPYIFIFQFYLQMYSATHFVISGNCQARYACGRAERPGVLAGVQLAGGGEWR
jgi:hypothetical protein